MKKLKSIMHCIGRIPALKYIVVTLIAVVLIGFVDENSIWHHIRNRQRISELQSEIADYTYRYQRDERQVRQLESDPKAIEKIARERYFMKTDDEDIFILTVDQKPTSVTSDETVE